MTKEEILKMAQDAGFLNFSIPPEVAAVFYRFATLVRNAALEEAAQKCESNHKRFGSYTGTLKAHDEDTAAAIRNLKEPTP